MTWLTAQFIWRESLMSLVNWHSQKKIVNWPCDKLNSASLFIILLVGQEVEIWMSTWSFRPAAYIEWMVAVLMTKRYKWNGLNLVVLETLVLKAPWRKSSPSFSFSIMTFLRMLNKTLLWLSLSASKEYYCKISSNEQYKTAREPTLIEFLACWPVVKKIIVSMSS